MRDYGLELRGGFASAPASAAYNFGQGDFTITAWVSTQSGGTIVSRKGEAGGPGNGGFTLRIEDNTGSLTFVTDDGTNAYQAQGFHPPIWNSRSDWRHVAAVRKGTALQLFLDGKSVQCGFVGEAGPLDVNNGEPLVIGDSREVPMPLVGVIEDVTLWNYALTEADLAPAMFNRLSGSESGLRGYWPLDGDFTDKSGIRNHATAMGEELLRFVPVFHAVWAEGANSYAFSSLVSGADSFKRARADGGTTATEATPGTGLTRVRASTPKDLIDAIFHIRSANPSLGAGGRLNQDGTVTAQRWTAKKDSPCEATLIVDASGEYEYTVLTWIECSSDVKLTRWDWTDLQACDAGVGQVWTSEGWATLPYGEPDGASLVAAMAEATTYDEKEYWYRIVLTDVTIGETTAVIAADSEARLSFYTAPIAERKQCIEVPSDTPFLYGVIATALDDASFPLGAALSLVDPVEDPVDQEYAPDAARAGSSLWQVAIPDPLAGGWTLTVRAPQNVALVALFQSLPVADFAETIRAALEPLYGEHHVAAMHIRSDGASVAISCYACVVGTTALAIILTTALILWGISATVASGGVGAAFFILIGSSTFLTALHALYGYLPSMVAGALCASLGVCEPPTYLDLNRLVTDDYRYDQYCYLTSHNAFSYSAKMRANYAQQDGDIAWQLDHGAEALMVDTHLWGSGNDRAVYLCHCSGKPDCCGSWASYFTQPGSKPLKLSDALTTVVDCLRCYPNRIITLLVESRTGDSQEAIDLLKHAFDSSGATPFCFYADRVNNGSTGKTWSVDQQGWPLRRWMIDNGLRLVVFSDRAAEMYLKEPRTSYGAAFPGSDDGLPYLWRFAVESEYGDASLDPTPRARARAGSARLSDKTKALFVLNQFKTVTSPLYYYRTVNSAERLMRAVDRFSQTAGRPPNFLALDFFTYPPDGPAKVIGSVNQKLKNP